MVSLTPTEEIEEFVKIAQQRLVFKLVDKNTRCILKSQFENHIEEKIPDTRTKIISTLSNKEGCILTMIIWLESTWDSMKKTTMDIPILTGKSIYLISKLIFNFELF